LRETERAAGGDELLKDHDDLINFRRKEISFLSNNDSWNAKLQNLEERNRAVEREVTRFLERDAIMKKIEVLKLTIPWLKYDELATVYQECKEEKERVKKEYEELFAMAAPMEEQIKKQKAELTKYTHSVNTSAKEVNETTLVFKCILIF
jgi:chromosome segregation ATPase